MNELQLIEMTALFLAVTLALYALLGGADFGAGIVELFAGGRDRETRSVINQAIAPVWEANHVWLIVAVVILFTAFPQAYARLSTTLHIPLALMLVGIVLRGCAFTFRHYDPRPEEQDALYTRVFALSSVFTALLQGIIVGAVISGRAGSDATDFVGLYVLSWLHPFCALVGVFTCALYGTIAAVFLVGETRDSALRGRFVRRAKRWLLCTVMLGGVVLASAYLFDLQFAEKFFEDARSRLALGAATALLPVLWLLLTREMPNLSRIVMGLIVALILLGWIAAQFPALIPAQTSGGEEAIYALAAPAPTLRLLLWALFAGLALIVPALIFLLRTFKRTPSA